MPRPTAKSVDPQTMIEHSRVRLDEREIAAVLNVLQSGQINDSGVTRQFEAALASYLDRRFAWSTTTGTLAVHLSLKLLEVGPGDEVLLQTYVCDDVLSAILQTGATPVPVDMDEDFNVDAADLDRKVSRRTKAAVVAHMFGLPARPATFDLGSIPVIEDCAQSFATLVDGKQSGTLGALSTFSFHALKLLSAGEGGMIATDDEGLADRMQSFKSPNFSRSEHRLDYHLSNIHSALGLAALDAWPAQAEQRQGLAERYGKALSGVRDAQLPNRHLQGRESSWQRYCLLLGETQRFSELEALYRDRGIVVRRPVKSLNHRLLGLPDSHCPRAAALFERIVSIPFYPNLADSEVETVLEATLELVE